jgi:hypothetical protein
MVVCMGLRGFYGSTQTCFIVVHGNQTAEGPAGTCCMLQEGVESFCVAEVLSGEPAMRPARFCVISDAHESWQVWDNGHEHLNETPGGR